MKPEGTVTIPVSEFLRLVDASRALDKVRIPERQVVLETWRTAVKCMSTLCQEWGAANVASRLEEAMRDYGAYLPLPSETDK